MAQANSNLRIARNIKNDEFYTMFDDIEKEVENYKEQLENKIILCNCDNPNVSQFWKYFHTNFEKLKLKKIICTYYNPNENTYKLEYTGGNDDDILVGEKTKLSGTGDFRSDECIEILKSCDIVITNPPFSLFREYISIIMKYKKKFLIIGSKNAITYKDFFPLLMKNQVWIGINNVKEFITPTGETKKFGNIGWYTNLDIIKRHKKILLKEKYSKEKYPKYDNFNAINVNKLSEIPYDYDDIMGVPISYMDIHNPEQFEIIALGTAGEEEGLFKPTIKYKNLLRYNPDGTTTKEHIAYNQCLTLGHDTKPKGIYGRADNSDKYLTIPYKRVLIKKV